MAANIITKRAGEKILVGSDFSPRMGSSATISSIISVTSERCDGGVSDVTITSQTITSQSVIFYVEGGTAGIRYTVITTITTSEGETLIEEGTLVVL